MRGRFQLALAVVAAIAITVAVTSVAARRELDPAPASAPEVEGKPMVYLKGGTFLMGTKDPAHEAGDDDESPAHRVTLSPFYIDATEVTNAQFARFVAATGYKTDAEREGSAWIFKQGFKDWESVKELIGGIRSVPIHPLSIR